MENDGRRLGRKREFKMVENESSREVTFTKRRKGLFRKASELSLLCGAEIAIIAYSPHGNSFPFGAPSLDSILRRFKGVAAVPEAYSHQDKDAVSRIRRRWWEDPIEGMGAEELDQFGERLQMLMAKVERRVQEIGKSAADASAGEVEGVAVEEDITGLSESIMGKAVASLAAAPAPAAGEVVGSMEDDVTAMWKSILETNEGEEALLGGRGGGTGSSESLSSLFGSLESLSSQFGSPESMSSDGLMFDFDLGIWVFD